MPADIPAPTARIFADPMLVAVVCLGFTQIIAWGTTLYCLAVLGRPIAADTGWSQTLVFGGLTVGLLVSSVVSTSIGRLIDRRGARLVMCLGSLLVAIALTALALAREPTHYLAAWALLGLAMRMSLYDAAFVAIVQVTPTRGRRAISYLTLFGGLASTVFWPIGYAIEASYGWQTTLFVFAAINLFVCLPLNWFGLARRESAAPVAPAATEATLTTAPVLEGRQRRLAMILFGFVMTASAFCYGALAAHLVTVLAAVGLSAAVAVTLASAKGIAQTLSRLGDLVFGKNLHPLDLGRITLAFLPLSFAVLIWGGASLTTAITFIVLFGIANGLTTIVRGAVPLALFGAKGYGEILGILATPYLVLNAIAPMIFALIDERYGGAAATYTLLAVGLLAWISMEIMALWYRRRAR